MVNVPPLCIIQQRLNSTRLPGKALMMLGHETLNARAWRMASTTFGPDHCVVAIPTGDEEGPLGDELRKIKARIFAWDGDESDLLGRFYYCAHKYRWAPESVIVRWTPDDPFKNPAYCDRVVRGERLAVELGCEAFTLAMLDEAQKRIPFNSEAREHITHAILPTPPPPPPSGIWTIDTMEDLMAARARLAV